MIGAPPPLIFRRAAYAMLVCLTILLHFSPPIHANVRIAEFDFKSDFKKIPYSSKNENIRSIGFDF